MVFIHKPYADGVNLLEITDALIFQLKKDEKL